MDEEVPDSDAFACPHCGVPVAVTASEPFQRCLVCAEEFVLPAGGVADEKPVPREDELDGWRVRQVAMSRRTAIRTQTYFFVLTAACAGAVVECAYEAWRAGRWGVGRGVMIGLGLLAAWATRLFFRKARAMARELSKPLLPEPSTPPDFSQLGDGSQVAKHLEDL